MSIFSGCAVEKTQDPENEGTEALKLFIMFHVETPQLQDGVTPDPDEFYFDFQEATSTIRSIANILEKHNAKGTFLFRRFYPEANCIKYKDEVNLLLELVDRGHEVGMHEHAEAPYQIPQSVEDQYPGFVDISRTIHAVKNTCQVGDKAITIAPALGMYLYPEDKAPDKVLSGFTECVDNGIKIIEEGIGTPNGMYAHVPFRPHRDVKKFAEHDLNGPLVAFQGAKAPRWEDAIGPDHPEPGQRDELDDWSFDKLAIDVIWAVDNRTPGKINYFGFISHDHQYMDDMDTKDLGNYYLLPFRGHLNRYSYLSQQALDALDRFLTNYTDPLVKKGKISYATMTDIYNAYLEWEKVQ